MERLEPGRIILINGASSSGKTSMANALQELLDEPFLTLGIDTFCPALPHEYVAFDPPDGHPAHLGMRLRTTEMDGARAVELLPGPVFHRFIRGMHLALAGFARAGNNVIFDDVLYHPAYIRSLTEALQGIPVLFVGVRLSLSLNEEREQLRGDRCLGHARGHHHLVHRHDIYDLEIDTGAMSAEEAARRIAERLAEERPPDAFERLRRRFAVEAAAGEDGDDAGSESGDELARAARQVRQESA